MTPEVWFSIANTSVLPGWLLLTLAPRWRWTGLISGRILPLALAVLYAAVLGSQIGRLDGGFSSLDAVARLFANPWALLAGWVHYLAFDLFVGSWMVRNAQEHGVRHWLIVPCLILTFLFGPTGLLLYLALRRRRLEA